MFMLRNSLLKRLFEETIANIEFFHNTFNLEKNPNDMQKICNSSYIP